MRTASIALLAALLACAGSRKEEAGAQPSAAAKAAGGAPLAEAPQQSGAAASPGAQQPGTPAAPVAQQATPGAQQAGKETPDAAGQKSVGAAATGTAPAAQSAQGSTSTASAAPLMPDEPFRAEQPKPLAVQPHFQAPVPVQKRLRNGARVLIVENHQIPLVAIEVRLLHGVDADPRDKPGLAEFVADAVDEGTRSRSAEKLAEEIEDLAAHLSAGAGLETSSVHLNCLTETLPKALDLLADVVQNPAFRKEDVERVRVLKLTQLEQKKASIGALAGDEAARILYGDKHPWGQPSGGTPQSVGSISPEDLAGFHSAFWVPNDAIISVSGDVSAAEIVRLLDDKFAGWKAKPIPRLALPPLPRLSRRSVDAMDKANATQSQVWVVGRLFKATHPDAIPLRVANMVLGGLFTSRLNMNLREKHGYSYGVRSGVSLMRGTGTFTASGGVIAKNTVEAVAEYESELKRFATGEVTASELASSKEALIRGLPSALETNDAVANALGNIAALGLPLDYYRTVPGRIAEVGLEAVRRVVTTWVKPEKWPIVIVGPVAQSEPALKKLGLGPVTLVAAPGATPGKPAPPSGAH